MDSRLLGYYERELRYLREMGTEFARDFPNIAGRLSLEQFTCADPYVERLLEGFAFLSARVQLKLDSEFPRFVQNLLQTVYPQYLAPTPSMCVVQFQPEPADPSLAKGYDVPRGTAVRSLTGPRERTACEFRTAHALKLYPVVVEEAQYCTRELQSLDLPTGLPGLPRGAAAGIRLRLRCTGDMNFDGLDLDRLPLFVRATPDVQSRVYEQVFGHAKAVVVQPLARPAKWRHVVRVTPEAGVRRVGYDDAEALLPYGYRSFQGYRLLHEYFAFPQRFMFFELDGLAGALRRCPDKLVDVVVLLDQHDLNLENALDASNFAPYCSPAVNLFPKRCDRIHVSDRFSEFHVVPDRTRPLAFEVYEVSGVGGFAEGSPQERPFLPFYAAREGSQDGGAFYAVNRVPRHKSEKEEQNGSRSKYAGSEVYLSLVDATAAPVSTSLRQLAVEALCTNRDLPLFVPVGAGDTDFLTDSGAPVKAIRCVSGRPTSPKPSHAEGQVAWRLVSHLSLNYLSLVDTDRTQGAAGLRELLSLYADLAEAHARRQIEGVKSVESAPIYRRIPAPGPISFGRGVQATLTLDEAAFEGTGAFLLGAVLERFFAKHASINSFTETVVKTVERGEIMRWPARIGRRHVL